MKNSISANEKLFLQHPPGSRPNVKLDRFTDNICFLETHMCISESDHYFIR